MAENQQTVPVVPEEIMADYWDVAEGNDEEDDEPEIHDFNNNDTSTTKTDENTTKKKANAIRENNLNETWNKYKNILRNVYLTSLNFGEEESFGVTTLRCCPSATRSSLKIIRVYYLNGKVLTRTLLIRQLSLPISSYIREYRVL